MLSPVKTVNVDKTGQYRISLPPGFYLLTGAAAKSGLMQMTSKPFHLRAGQVARVDLVQYAT